MRYRNPYSIKLREEVFASHDKPLYMLYDPFNQLIKEKK
jgi:hypothetical protein